MSDLFETFGFDLQRFVGWTFDQATVGTATETTAGASGKYFWNGSDFEGEGISSATFTGTVSAIVLSSAVGGGTAYNILSVSSISDLVPDEDGTVTITDAGGATLASTGAVGTFVFDEGTFKVAGDSEVTFSLSSTNVTGISRLLSGSVEGTLNGITINSSPTKIDITGDSDGFFTYTVDESGEEATLGGVGGSNVTVSSIAYATVVKTDKAGEYTFLGETFNTSDSALTVSVVSQSSVAVTELDEGEYITGSFSVVASVNGVSFAITDSDGSFKVYGGASAAGISMIADVTAGATINNAGGASIVQTDAYGEFFFASNSAAFTTAGDSEVQFLMNGNSVSGIDELASGSVSGLLNGLTINGSSKAVDITGDTDGLFTYTVGADGKATLSGVGGSNVTVNHIADATVVQTSESGTYTFLGETFNTSDSALTVSLLSTSSIAITDLDAGEYIEGSFSSVASINGESFKVSGDSAFGVTGATSGIATIYNLSDSATVSAAGGASQAITDEAGTFTFGSTSFVVAGDSEVTFLLDSNGAVYGVSGLDENATLSGDLNELTSINGTSFNVDNDTDLAVVGGASAIGIKSINKLSNGADVVHAGGAASAITDTEGTFYFSTAGQSFIVYGDSSVDFVMDGDKVVGITGLSGAVETSGALFAGGFSVNGKKIDITGDDGTIIVESEDGTDVDNIINVGAADNGTVTIATTGDADWVVTDKTGTFNFTTSGQVFTTDDDNLGFYMDEDNVKAVESLNGGASITADTEVFTGASAVAVNNRYVKLSGDENDLAIYGNDSFSSVSMISKVGGSDGVTITTAAGATTVETDADGKFYFETKGQSFTTDVTDDDNSMQFLLDDTGKVTGVRAFSDGTLILNGKQTTNLDVNTDVYSAQSLSLATSNDVTLTIDPFEVVKVEGLSAGDGISGLVGASKAATVVAQNGTITVNNKAVTVVEDEDEDGKYNIIVTGGSTNSAGTVTNISEVQGPATVDAASVSVRVNKDASSDDFVIGSESYTMDDSQDVNSGFTFTTNRNGVLTGVYSLEGALSVNDGAWSGTVNNDTVAVYNPGSSPARVNTDGSDITSIDGLSSGALVNAPGDVPVAMPGTSSKETPTKLIVNGNTYQLLNDEDGINVTGDGVITGLDPYASLKPGEAGTYTVNGETVKVAQDDVLIGKPDGSGAYIYDADNVLIRKATTKPEIQYMVGLSTDTDTGSWYNYEDLEELKADAASGLVDLDQPLVFTLYNDSVGATQTFDVSGYRYTKKIHLSIGDQEIAFNDEGHNYAIVGFDGYGNGKKTITLGDGGDVVLMDMDSRSSSVNIIGGAGADSVFVRYAAPTTIDLSAGGDDRIVTEAEANARITLEGYDFMTGAGIMVEEFPTPISAAIDKDVINFGDGVVSITTDEGNSEIFVNDTITGGTIVNLYTYQGVGQAVGFTNSDGGAIDASSATDPLILLGNDDNKKTGGSTITGGKGNDTIYAGTDDVINGGAGNNVVKLYNDSTRGGAEVILSAGRTTVEGMNNTLTSSGDTLSFSVINGKADIKYDGSNLIVSGDGFYGSVSGVAVIGASATTTVAGSYDLTPGDYMTQFIKNTDDGTVYKAAIGRAGSVMEVTRDADVRPNAYLGGENAGLTFENYTGDAVIDLGYDWQENIVDGEGVYIDGVNSMQAGEGNTIFKGSSANETLIAGKGNTSLYGDGGTNLLVGYDDTDKIKEGQTTFFLLGVRDGAINTIRNFDFATDDNYTATAKVTADIIEVDTENNVFSRVDLSKDDVLVEVTNKAGTDTEKAVIEGAAGKDMIVSGVVAQVAEDVLVFERADFYLATGKNATVSVSSALDNNVNLWLDDTDTGKNFEGDIKVIDARSSAANAELAGNNNDNEIYAGSGETSLWGGSGGDDLLVGGTGKDTFYYGMGNGNDTIDAAGDGDLVVFTDIALSDLSVESISSGAIEFSTSDGGRITVNDGGHDVGFKVGDQTYYINSGRDEFYQK